MKASPTAGKGKPAPKNRAAEISAARKAAFSVLLAVERGHAHSDDLLRGKAVNDLSPPDRHLATALVLGVLRWQIRLDHQIRPRLNHPNAKLDAEVCIALRLGAFQILHMDRIPARAAIDESVELAKQAGHRFASAMVNAVLRKLVPKTGAHRDENISDAAMIQAHPAWMVERWTRFYGPDAARAICRNGQTQPALALRFDEPHSDADFTDAGVALEPGRLLTAARIVATSDVFAKLGEGHARIQDEGSQLVAEIAAANLPRPDGRILDACAAPGGKTLILAERNPQAALLACELSAQRYAQLRERLGKYAPRVQCREADVTTLPEQAAFDVVLADVPCSGTGTLGRNPEIRHRLIGEELSRQSDRQRAILAAALRAVRPGGRVVYSTCSMEPEENEQVVAAVLAETPGAHAVRLDSSIEGLENKSILAPGAGERLRASLTPEGALRLLPGVFRTDGFFVALIQTRP